MADHEICLEVLSKFQLQILSDEWVKSLWDCDFTEIEAIEIDVQDELQSNNYYTEPLRQLQSALDDWIKHKENQSGEGLWTVLVENDISHKNLIALFAYLIDIAQVKNAESTQKEAGILSCSNYLKLLSVPGSVAFKIFHPVLYEKAVDILKMWWNSIGTCKRKKSLSPSMSQKSKKKSKGNKSRHQTIDINQDFDDEDEDQVEELAPQEINMLKKRLLSLLKDLVFLLEVNSLRQSETSLYHTVQILAKLTRFDTELFDGEFDNNLPTSRLPLPGLAYKGLSLLCKPLHGHVVSITHSTCKNLLPNLLMLIGDNKVAPQTIPKHAQVAREHTTKFVCYLLKQCEERNLGSIRTLLQHMCTKVPDKAEYRAKVSHAVVTILKKLPSKAYGKMVEWFYSLSKHAKTSNRAFALDIVSSLLSLPETVLEDVTEENRGDDTAENNENESSDDTPKPKRDFVTHKSLIDLLLERCSDISPTVRSRAIAAFSQCFIIHDNKMKDILKGIVTPMAVKPAHHPPFIVPTPEMENRAQQIINESVAASDQTVNKTAEQTLIPVETPAQSISQKPKTPFHGVHLTPYNPNLPDEEGVISMFRRRARDEAVSVRKAALHAIESIIRFEAPDFRRQNLEILVERCRDPALSSRKQAMQSLTDLLLDMSTEKPLQQAWLNGVIPLVIDRETSVQEKCLDIIEDIIISNVVPYNRSKSDAHKLAWEILTVIESFENVELRRYLQKACIYLARQGKLKQGLISALETHIDTENNRVAWMLLAEVAPSSPKLGHKFVIDYWQNQANNGEESDLTTLNRVLTVMQYTANHIPQQDRAILIESLKSRLMKFDSPPELIAINIKVLSKLCAAESSDTGKSSDRDVWCTALLQASDKYLSHVILEELGSVEDEEMVIRHLFTLGEIVQICPAKVPKRIHLIVQSLIAAPCISSLPSTQASSHTEFWGSNSKDSSGNSNEHSEECISNSQSSSQESRPPSSQDLNSRPSSQFTQTQATQVFSQFRGSKMSSRIRAFAFITLGKLCLQNPDLAKKCVAALARELETSMDSTIRNNVVIILCDLCVRYTTTADVYISNIAACLKDVSPMVRKQTLILITRLLQEDFLKWKGVLFFRFITTILDENNDIAEFAEFCLEHVLFQRHPNMFFNHFMECIFHFNAYEGHGAFNRFTQTEREKRMFTLRGKNKHSKRLQLYTFMLHHMPDEHRFQMTAKICQEILGGFVDGIIQLTDDSACLLKDSLAILCCKEIKLSSLNTKVHDEGAASEQERVAVVIDTAKKTLITQVVKKNVIENIVPIIISLKHMLEKHRSPILKDLMYYLRELMKDYKTEVKDILAADKQLASEIEFDLRKFEEQQQPQPETPVPVVQAANTPSVRPSSAPSRTGTPTKNQQPGPAEQALPGQSPNKENERRSVSNTPSKPDFKSPASVPARNTPLSTLAILKSAKKALEKAQEMQNSSSPRNKSKHRQSDVLPNVNVEDVDNTSRIVTPDEGITPSRQIRKTNRAISTPTGALSNITFRLDANVTMIPPSPIPTSMPIRVYPAEDSGDAVTPKKRGSKSAEVMEDVVFMFSPDKPLPKPRMWNIQSKAPGAGNLSQDASELKPDISSDVDILQDLPKTRRSRDKPSATVTDNKSRRRGNTRQTRKT